MVSTKNFKYKKWAENQPTPTLDKEPNSLLQIKLYYSSIYAISNYFTHLPEASSLYPSEVVVLLNIAPDGLM